MTQPNSDSKFQTYLYIIIYNQYFIMQNKFKEQRFQKANKQSDKNFFFPNNKETKITNKTFYNFIDSKTVTTPPWMKLKVLKSNQEINSNNNNKIVYNTFFTKKSDSNTEVSEKKLSKFKDDCLELIAKKFGIQSNIRPTSVPGQQQKTKLPLYNLSIFYQKELLEQRKKIWQKYSPLQSQGNKSFTYYLGSGNNHQLIRRIMKNRPHWSEYQVGISTCINFKWQQTHTNYNYSQIEKRNSLQVLNHFEHHEEISTKSNLIKNLQIYCETNKLQIFSITPVTFIINLQSQYAEYQLKKFLKYFIRKNQPKNDKEKQMIFEALKKIKPLLKQGCEIKKKTNILSKPNIFNSYYNGKNLWLLKPTGLNRGRGIQLFNTVQQLQKLLRQYKQLSLTEKKRKILMLKSSLDEIITSKETFRPFSKTQTEKLRRKKKSGFKIKKITKKITNINQQKILTTNDVVSQKNHNLHPVEILQFVIQKYIQKPLLVQGRKFDIRIWILVDINLQVYIFKEGYIRTSSEIYNLDDINNYYIHLTNNAVQKNSENYGQYQQGNQISFANFEEAIRKNYENFQMSEVFQKIKEISFITLSSVKKKLDPHQRDISFELFGLDFIIDQDFKVWLIQVNTNPCIEQSSPILQMLIPRLINDTFKLTIDQYFKNESTELQRSKELKQVETPKQFYHVDGYKDNENMFESLGKLIPNYLYKKQGILGRDEI